MAQLDEIVGKSNIQGVLDLDKALIALDETFMKVLKSSKETSTILNTSTQSFNQLKTVQEQTVSQTNKLSEAEKQAEKIANENAKAAAKLEAEIKKKTAADEKAAQKVAEHNAALVLEVKSLADAERQNKALQAEKKKLDLTTEAGKKKLQEYNAIIDKNTKLQFDNADSATKQRMNIGSYTDSIKKALDGMGPFGSAINDMTSKMSSFASSMKNSKAGTDVASTGMRGLGKALIASGIGAIIIAVVFAATALYKIFSSFSPLVKIVQQAMAGLSAVFDVLKNTVVAIFTGAKNLREAFSGLGGRMKDAAIEAANLKKAMQALEGAQLRAEVSTAQLQTKINELILQSKNRTLSEKERIALIDEALALEQKQFDIEKANADEQLRIAQEAIAIKAELTDEEKERLKTEGIAFAQSLKSRVAGIGEEITALKDALINEETVNQKSISLREKAMNRREVLEEKAAEKEQKRKEEEQKRLAEIEQMQADQQQGFRDELQKTINELSKTDEIIDETFDIPDPEKQVDPWLTALEETQQIAQQALQGTEEYQAKLLEKQLENLKKYHDLGLISEEEYQAAINQINEKGKEQDEKDRQDKITAAEQVGQALYGISQMYFNLQTADMERQKAHELELAAGNAELIAKINDKYAKKEKELKTKQAKTDKAFALFGAIINVARAVSAAMTAGPGVGLVLAILTAALGAIQVGIIASQPIPQFFKGTKSAPDGLISVGEKGKEMIQTRSGKVLMATRPTLLSGMKGARIYSNPETEKILAARNAGYDSPELRRTLKENNDKLIRTIQNKKEIIITPAKGSRITERQGNYYKHYINRKLGQS